MAVCEPGESLETAVPRMRDVARLAGVSTKTVSEVVNGVGQVRDSTRARVEAVIAELGYRPNPLARRLSAGAASTITVAIPRLASGYHAALAAALCAAAGARGIDASLTLLAEGDAGELEELAARAELTDGLILVTEGDGPSVPTLRLPLVVVSDRALEQGGDVLVVDQRLAVRIATDHLRRAGRRRIAVLGATALPSAVVVAVDRVRPTTRGGAFQAVGALLLRYPDIDGLIGGDDSVALGAMHALRDAGRRVPDDIAVVAASGSVEADYTWPSLSTVEADLDQVARTAVGQLLERIGGSTRARRTAAAELRLVERESSRSR